MTKEIPLVNGHAVAIVDDDVYPAVAGRRWYAAWRNGRVAYARTFYRDDDGKWAAIGLHRVVMDAPDGVHVDHINRDGLDCRRANMRFADKRENAWNTGRRSNARSRFKGVHVRRGKWAVLLSRDNRHTYFGQYDDETQAARVYDAAATRVRGEFAVTNFPDIDPAADAIVTAILEKKGLAA